MCKAGLVWRRGEQNEMKEKLVCLLVLFFFFLQFENFGFYFCSVFVSHQVVESIKGLTDIAMISHGMPKVADIMVFYALVGL